MSTSHQFITPETPEKAGFPPQADQKTNAKIEAPTASSDTLQLKFEANKKAAEQGDARAQFAVAEAYLNGQGVIKDEKVAFEWYQKAAEQGYAPAQCSLGSMLEVGGGRPKDQKEAAKWFRKAADQGYALAQVQVGYAYLRGQGIAEDQKEAAKWFRKAADQGYALAQLQVGSAYLSGEGIAKDERTGIEWIRKAAKQKVAAAQFWLGGAYRAGLGVTKNEVIAVEWYRKAAEQGVAEAQYQLGKAYWNGQGIGKNEKLAIEWYQKAAEQGSAEAQAALAKLNKASKNKKSKINAFRQQLHEINSTLSDANAAAEPAEKKKSDESVKKKKREIVVVADDDKAIPQTEKNEVKAEKVVPKKDLTKKSKQQEIQEKLKAKQNAKAEAAKQVEEERQKAAEEKERHRQEWEEKQQKLKAEKAAQEKEAAEKQAREEKLAEQRRLEKEEREQMARRAAAGDARRNDYLRKLCDHGAELTKLAIEIKENTTKELNEIKLINALAFLYHVHKYNLLRLGLNNQDDERYLRTALVHFSCEVVDLKLIDECAPQFANFVTPDAIRLKKMHTHLSVRDDKAVKDLSSLSGIPVDAEDSKQYQNLKLFQNMAAISDSIASCDLKESVAEWRKNRIVPVVNLLSQHINKVAEKDRGKDFRPYAALRFVMMLGGEFIRRTLPEGDRGKQRHKAFFEVQEQQLLEYCQKSKVVSEEVAKVTEDFSFSIRKKK